MICCAAHTYEATLRIIGRQFVHLSVPCLLLTQNGKTVPCSNFEERLLMSGVTGRTVLRSGQSSR